MTYGRGDQPPWDARQYPPQGGAWKLRQYDPRHHQQRLGSPQQPEYQHAPQGYGQRPRGRIRGQ